ncbi:60S ribosomal protein L34-1, partial [Bienertia sinuspersici]
VYQTTKKRASGPKCPVIGKRIQGIPNLGLLSTREADYPGTGIVLIVRIKVFFPTVLSMKESLGLSWLKSRRL